ncbi:hypothetical protein HK096_005562 [Nowakowskiella sp. JEL0078]|nr:hypothetical protein HK096_005562 [Nowakowskiella sp. JEL0078]
MTVSLNVVSFRKALLSGFKFDLLRLLPMTQLLAVNKNKRELGDGCKVSNSSLNVSPKVAPHANGARPFLLVSVAQIPKVKMPVALKTSGCQNELQELIIILATAELEIAIAGTG